MIVADYVFSIGEACLCADTLKRVRLRDMSSPFDWIGGGTVGSRVDAVIAGFPDWLRSQDDMRDGNGCTQAGAHRSHLWYNVSTGYSFHHDFPEGEPLETAFPMVQARYGRRIARALERMESVRSFCAVWIESAVRKVPSPSWEELREVGRRLRARFGDGAHLVFVRYLAEASAEATARSDEEAGVVCLEAHYREWTADGRYAPDFELLGKLVCGQVRLRVPLVRRIVDLFHFCVSRIAPRDLRRHLRAKWHC